jgi:hypothetical protein
MSEDQTNAAVVTAKKKTGRPRVIIDTEEVYKLATQAYSIEQIAASLGHKAGSPGPSSRTIKRRLKTDQALQEAWHDGIQYGQGRLRSRMFTIAMQSNNLSVAERMCEFLAINWLGMNSGRGTSVEVNTSTSVQVAPTTANERIGRRIDDIAKRIHGRIAALAAGAGVIEQPVAGGTNGADGAAGEGPAESIVAG